jgi:drug/metabolite transporter (DMT)-like permease
MGPVRIAAIVILVAGVLALVYGGFSYTSKDTAAKLGPLEVKVEKENRVNVPVWAGVGAILVGGLLFVGAGRK